jgi:coenzyme F420-0:L-glutamate ligase/coenzyme F420-1:gamma-L-glutamate ligase
MGRAWRNGLTDVALGSAGIEPIRDHRGETDPYGNVLELTEMAVIDELAAAGELVKGKCDQVPVAVVRGYPGAGTTEFPGARVLLRDAASDMFSLGTAEARAAGLRDAATLPDSSRSARRPAAPDAVERALATVASVVDGISRADDGLFLSAPATAGPGDWVRLGAGAHRVRAALAAENVTSEVQIRADGVLVVLT